MVLIKHKELVEIDIEVSSCKGRGFDYILKDSKSGRTYYTNDSCKLYKIVSKLYKRHFKEAKE